MGQAIPAADKALETASDEALIELLTRKVQEGVRTHFEEVVKKENFETNDVAAGRSYVEAYSLRRAPLRNGGKTGQCPLR